MIPLWSSCLFTFFGGRNSWWELRSLAFQKYLLQPAGTVQKFTILKIPPKYQYVRISENVKYSGLQKHEVYPLFQNKAFFGLWLAWVKISITHHVRLKKIGPNQDLATAGTNIVNFGGRIKHNFFNPVWSNLAIIRIEKY